MSKILVIEDNYEVRTSIIDILESENHIVFSASDGKAGIQLSKEILPDLIICDIMMPGMDGYQVLNEVSKNEKTSLIQFIYLTAKVDKSDISKGLILGADDYILKPFKAVDLLKRVNMRLNKMKRIKNSVGFSNAKKTPLETSSDILINVNNKPVLIKQSKIIYIKAEGEYSYLYLTSGKRLLVRKLLKQWENFLPVNNFKRIHRSTIINIDYIEKIEKWQKRSFIVTLKNVDESFIVSERYSVKLKKDMSF